MTFITRLRRIVTHRPGTAKRFGTGRRGRAWLALARTSLGLLSGMVAGWPLAAGSAEVPAREKEAPKSVSPVLEAAVKALADRRLEEAASGFEAVLREEAAPAFVRGLAHLGLAETRLAAGDQAGALAVWQRQADDGGLKTFHRDEARRRLMEAGRVRPGQSARTASEFREELPVLPGAAVILQVAVGGSDDGDGSSSRPLATLEGARRKIRSLVQARGGSVPDGGVRVILESGDYPVTRSFRLEAADSGAPGKPIVYQAREGATVRLRGGLRMMDWRPIGDPAVKARLDPAIAGSVVEVDLARWRERDWGDPTALKKRPELWVDGVPQTLARWPNEGFVKTGEITGTNTFKVWNSLAGCKDGRFRFVEDRPRTWVDEPDVRLYGYWFWDWYEEYQTVVSIDSETRGFVLGEPYSVYGYRKDQRYFAVNVLRELDRAGEWYLDRSARRLYWLPPSGVDPDRAEIVLSMFDEPFIDLRDASHVVLKGFLIEEGRGDGIRLVGGSDCLVAGCTVRRLGGDAILVEGGRHHGVFGCRIEAMGCGGIRMAGGDRKTLEPGRHFVENCTVRDISRLKRTYTPAVHLDGCGQRIAHNRFEDMPSSALRVEGNDHLIELNHVRDVVKESDDQGGVDMFGNPLYRGVVFRWNRWSDIGGGTHNGGAGVRLDDMISGVVVYGNVFERCGAVLFGGVQIHGGKDNLIDGNLFLDCFAGVSFSRWGEKRWLEATSGFLGQAAEPPYATRYPELSRMKTGADVNDLCRNVYLRCGRVYLRDGGVPRSALNLVSDDAIDLAALRTAEDWRATSLFRRALIDPIPLDEIGPYDHPWRAR